MLFVLSVVNGCGNQDEAMKEATSIGERNGKVRQSLQNAISTSTNAESQAWHEFLAEWPDARQGIGLAWYEEKRKFEGNLSASTLIEDRYLFRIVLYFEMDADYKSVTFPKTRFQFSEIKRVIVPREGPQEGGISITYQPDTKWFGLREWKKLVDSRWDLSSISITVISNSPIPGLRSAWPYLSQ